MGLNSGDVIVVYSSAPEQRIASWFQIRAIETLSIASIWNRYHDVLGIEHAEYLAHFSDLEYAVALHVGEVQRVEFYFASGDRKSVRGFVPPAASASDFSPAECPAGSGAHFGRFLG
jgi:predicted transcriptional regulator